MSPTDVELGHDNEPIAPGVALCLSGGGYRAMLFHVGALLRLNEAGWLPRLDRVSSVSGGSITAATLAVGWPRLQFDGAGRASNLDALVRDRVRALASTSIDVRSVLSGILRPRETVADRVARRYDELLDGKTLRDLPEQPRFVICATNLTSGVLWRFQRPYMGDYRVGRIKDPVVPLAVAVAASAAFPPVLSPLRLELPRDGWIPDETNDLTDPAMRRAAVLSDGGVYDNLGLEPANRFRTLLISDGGGQLAPSTDIASNWVGHTRRVLGVIDLQVRSRRKYEAVSRFKSGAQKGAYWGIRTAIDRYPLADPLPCPRPRTDELARIPTRLKALDDRLQERLINWGYAVCDAALRAHVDPAAASPAGFPYPAAGV